MELIERFMSLEDNIYVAGHRGLAGSAICRSLVNAGYKNLIKMDREQLDLRDKGAVFQFFEQRRPKFVFLAAARVGGILANDNYPADFISDNLAIQSNVIEGSFRVGVERLLFLGSSCIYPKLAPQPIAETSLLTGLLEPTNRPYAIAKIAGIELCWSYNRQHGTRFLSVMPTNLYGPGDNFDLQNSHVLPALLLKTARALQNGDREVTIWGTGNPRREFLHSHDLAAACQHLMNLDELRFETLFPKNEAPIINVGTGLDLTIRELAEMIVSIVGFKGRLAFDRTKPDGTPRKVLNVERIHKLGWNHEISLESGIEEVWKVLKLQI